MEICRARGANSKNGFSGWNRIERESLYFQQSTATRAVVMKKPASKRRSIEVSAQ